MLQLNNNWYLSSASIQVEVTLYNTLTLTLALPLSFLASRKVLEQVEEEAAFPETRGRVSIRQRVDLPETIAEVPEGASTEGAEPGLEVGGGNSVLAEEYL